MANKEYLDAEGVARLKAYIDDQVDALRQAINLLNGNTETPGSIKSMIDDAINNIRSINGGSAPESEDEP